MKERLRLNIEQPCHENWNAMTPTEQGRHCQSCCKTVVDFTTMSDREIMNYISFHANGDTCGRVHDHQLNRVIQTLRERAIASWKYFWTLAIGSLLLSYRSLAQSPKSKTMDKSGRVYKEPKPMVMGMMMMAPVRTPATRTEVQGRVVDEDGRPVPYASITLQHPERLIVADSGGRYTFPANDFAAISLSVSAAGYEDMPETRLNGNFIKSSNVSGKIVITQLNDWVLTKKVLERVVVVGYGTIMGKVDVISTIVSEKKKESVSKDSIKVAPPLKKTALLPVTGTKDGTIKVYPNPVAVNGMFYVKFNVKEAGEYNLQLMDASGRIIGGRKLTIAQSGQVEAFPVSAVQAQGMYFIRVAGSANDRVYTTKLLVQ